MEDIELAYMDPDYERFDELMTFWESIPALMHGSWHLSLEVARNLPQEQRPLHLMRKLVSNAFYNEYLDHKLLKTTIQVALASQPIDPRNEGFYTCCLTRLIGLGDQSTPMRVSPEHLTLHLASAKEIFEALALGGPVLDLIGDQDTPWEKKIVDGKLKEAFMAFKTFLREERFHSWRRRWMEDFPELLGLQYWGEGTSDCVDKLCECEEKPRDCIRKMWYHVWE